jgi:WD40 repeat protein
MGTAVAFLSDGKTLASGSHDGSMQLWEIGTGKLLRETKGQKNPDPSNLDGGCFFSTNKKTFIAATRDWNIRVCEVGSGDVKLQFKPEGIQFGSPSAVSPDGKTLVIGDTDSIVHLIDTGTGKETRGFQAPIGTPEGKWRGHRRWAGLRWSAFSPDGRYLTTVGIWSMHLWDLSTGKLIHHIKDSSGAVVFSPDGKYLACGNDGAIRLYKIGTGKEVRRFEQHAGWIRTIAFSPDGKKLGTCETPYTVSLWDVNTGKRIHHFPGHQAEVQTRRDEVRFWRADTGRLVRSFPIIVDDGHYPCYALSADGKTFAAPADNWGQGEGGIRLWDTISGQLIVHLKGQRFINALAFSPDNRTLASAGGDTTILLWDLSEARLVGLWDKLAAINEEAGRAKKKLLATHGQAVRFLSERLRRVAALEARTAGLISDLDSDSFKVRQKAMRDLENRPLMVIRSRPVRCPAVHQ